MGLASAGLLPTVVVPRLLRGGPSADRAGGRRPLRDSGAGGPGLCLSQGRAAAPLDPREGGAEIALDGGRVPAVALRRGHGEFVGERGVARGRWVEADGENGEPLAAGRDAGVALVLA